ncbi:MAG: hypothetical protein CBC48_10970 [bacterium TMED88]|nr:hypothetical protein [Deltaproteobacteria bacterium]OUV30052.1 MAG: hypothetical protein CBC48_10970 [bacterium TMED88]
MAPSLDRRADQRGGTALDCARNLHPEKVNSELRRSWTRRVAHSLAGCMALLVVLSAAVSLAQDEVEVQAKPKLLLLPIVVHSSENPAYLREGLSDMLVTRFIQEDNFEVIWADDASLATTHLERAIEEGRAQQANFVLFGSFTRFGEGASLDMQAASTAEGQQGATLREIFVHSGSIGEVIPDLKDLVGKVTRFAIPQYRPGSPVTESAAAPDSRVNLLDLQRRVSALEEALQPAGPAGPAPPP